MNYKEKVLKIYPETNIGNLDKEYFNENFPSLGYFYSIMFTSERGIVLMNFSLLSDDELWEKAWEEIMIQFEGKLEE